MGCGVKPTIIAKRFDPQLRQNHSEWHKQDFSSTTKFFKERFLEWNKNWLGEKITTLQKGKWLFHN